MEDTHPLTIEFIYIAFSLCLIGSIGLLYPLEGVIGTLIRMLSNGMMILGISLLVSGMGIDYWFSSGLSD